MVSSNLSSLSFQYVDCSAAFLYNFNRSPAVIINSLSLRAYFQSSQDSLLLSSTHLDLFFGTSVPNAPKLPWPFTLFFFQAVFLTVSTFPCFSWNVSALSVCLVLSPSLTHRLFLLSLETLSGEGNQQETGESAQLASRGRLPEQLKAVSGAQWPKCAPLRPRCLNEHDKRPLVKRVGSQINVLFNCPEYLFYLIS